MKTLTQNPARWFKKNAAWLIVNAIATAWMVTLVVLSLSTGSTTAASGPGGRGGSSMLLHVSGEDAQRMLLLSLAMTPLHIVTGWNWVLGLKKSTGLWAFAFSAVHLVIYVARKGWIGAFNEFELLAGTLSLLIMLPLAITSTGVTMRLLGKTWKPLQRAVYLAGLLAAVHTALVGHGAPTDLTILAVLLAVRVPPVRQWIQSLRQRPALATVPTVR